MSNEDNLYDVEAIRSYKITENNQIRLLIKWENYGEESNTWEPLEMNYPDIPDMIDKYFKEHNLKVTVSKKGRKTIYSLERIDA